MEKAQNIAELGESVYNVIFSAPSFKNVHHGLLDNVIPALEKSKSKRLLVLGIGPHGAPYGSIAERFKELLKDSKVVFLDNSPSIITSCYKKYSELGIIGQNALDSQILTYNGNLGKITADLKSEGLDPFVSLRSMLKHEDLESKLTFLHHDLRDPIPDELGEFDVIESSFALHHPAQYRQTLATRLEEIYKMLDKEGLFHWGTGFCDMGYSEEKIKEIGKNISKETDSTVTIIDKRQPDYQYRLTFNKDEKPVIEKYDGAYEKNQIIITKEGLLNIPNKLLKKDNGDYFTSSPLINPENEKDKTSLIQPVRAFYTQTNMEVATIREYPPKAVEKAVKEDCNEQYNAEKGLVEYYVSEEDALKLLYEYGFKNIQIKRPNKNPWELKNLVNILSYK